MTRKVIHNFGKNVSFTPTRLAKPKNEHELLVLLSQHRGESIRVIASGHAWSDAIVTDGLLISVEHLNHVRISDDRQSVSVGAGCQVKQPVSYTHLTLPTKRIV